MYDFRSLSEKGRLYKNFIAYNLATILVFASYDTVASISSVFNQDESLGTTSQSIVYITQFFTALVLPQICIETIGFKFTLVLSQLFHFFFFIANFYPTWATLVPSKLSFFLIDN